jgi:hypothetical protein
LTHCVFPICKLLTKKSAKNNFTFVTRNCWGTQQMGFLPVILAPLREIFFGPHRYSKPKHIKISRNGAEAPRRNLWRGLRFDFSPQLQALRSAESNEFSAGVFP